MKTFKGEELKRLDPVSKWEGKLLWVVGRGHFVKVTGKDSIGNLKINGTSKGWVGFSHLRNSMTVIDMTGWGIRKMYNEIRSSHPLTRNFRMKDIKHRIGLISN